MKKFIEWPYLKPEYLESQGIPLGVIARFWENVRVNSGCWVWSGPRKTQGYGRIWWGKGAGRFYLEAHRVSWIIHNGPTCGLFVCHKCDNPPCVNPSHLFLGDAHVNAVDASRKLRLSHGSAHWAATLSERDVRDILIMRLSGERLNAIATAFCVSKQHIWRIIHGRSWCEIRSTL